ncbi:LLM class flavin-dependent oxidoreductase [Microbacterium sp.]|uniref:LLM class flavin-dependent oxidoreductase n=1 Tax=Microbacterium sp. TaxID=51671 RepID=UPI003C739B80
MSHVPLSVLDLAPFSAGQTPADGLRTSIRLARRAEELGYSRYWLAEHHLNPGISGSAPHVLLASIAAATERIRIGTAATIIGNYSPLPVAEAAGTVAALHPGRFDLGIGRSGAVRPTGAGAVLPAREGSVVDGLVLPATRAISFDSARFAAQLRLLGRTEGDSDRFEQDVLDILAFIAGPYVADEGVTVHATPAEGQDIQVWIHGSTAGPSAALAGRLGLPFGANYHVAPAFVLDAVAAYRDAFRPGVIAEPHVIVSVDVFAADDEASAERLSRGYAEWVHSIRAGQGAIAYPAPDDALAPPFAPEIAEVVKDRLDTRFTGSPERVAEQLETLQRVTGADELLLTTIAYDPRDREHSYELIADVWGLDAASAGVDADAEVPVGAIA